MAEKESKWLLWAIVVATIAGIFCGWYWGEKLVGIAFLGTLFLNALKMVVIPIVFCSIVVGVTSLGDIRSLGKLGRVTILYYLLTTFLAVLLGLLLANWIEPGVDSGIALGKEIPAAKPYSLIDFLMNLLPSNILDAMSKTEVLPTIIFALLFGAALSTLGEKGKSAIHFFGGANEAVVRIVHWILWLAPLGVFALVATKLGESGGGPAFFAEISKVGKYAFTVLLGLAIHGLIFLPLILWIFGGYSPGPYMVGMLPAFLTAFSTASSSATLPVTINCVEKNNNISPKVANFVLPLGATVNMDGTALYEAVAALFIAQSYGIELDLYKQVIVLLTATLAAIGAPGIPQAGLVTMVLVLNSVGLPTEGIGMILAIDWFLDRCRTTVNIWGDAAGAAVVAKRVRLDDFTADNRR